MTSVSGPATQDLPVHHRVVDAGGLAVAYREAGDPAAPAVLLLHGFPASSRMFRDLIPYLAGGYRVVAPDLPGFGHSALPDRARGPHTFDAATETIEAFLVAVGLERFAMYLFDFGGSIGWRLWNREAERVTALVLQNAPLYHEEGGDAWADLEPYWRDPTPAHRDQARASLTAENTRGQYLDGVRDPSRIDPDAPFLDQAMLERPGVDEVMLDLLLDISRQAPVFARARALLRERRPPALIVTGANDPLFPEFVMRGFLGDLPDAGFHALDTGHFALEDHAHEIGTRMRAFLDGLG